MTNDPSINPLGTLHLSAANPWPGLAAYDEGAQDFFHGRSAEAAELLRLIRLAPLTIIYGKSGLGKSSLLQAGLFPLLRENHYLPVYLRLDFSQQAKNLPLEQALLHLIDAIEQAGADSPKRDGDEGLWQYLHRKDFEIWSCDNHLLTPVLVFDQFEELFSHSDSASRIQQFFDNLADLIENRISIGLNSDPAEHGKFRLDLFSQHYRIVISFREDYLPEVKSWEEKVPSLLRNCLWLKPMKRQRAVEAIEQAGKSVLGEGVALLIVDFVGGFVKKVHETDAVIEPVLLSLFCYQLNLRRREGKIDKALVEISGKDILTNFYREALEDKNVKGSPDVRLFIENHLVQGERFRGAYPKEEALKENQLTESQLDALIDRRLLRVVQYEDTSRIELIHDCLVPVVCKARDERKIKARQIEWEKKIKEANDRAQEKEEYNRRLIKWRQGLLLFGSMAVIAAGVAIYQGYAAKKNEQRLKVREKIGMFWGLREKAPENATFQALQALKMAQALGDDSDQSQNKDQLQRAENQLRIIINSRLLKTLKLNGKVNAVSFTPNGDRLIAITTKAENREEKSFLKLWDAENFTDITPEPWNQSQDVINKIAFTAIDSKLVSGGGDSNGKIRLWDIDTGKDITPHAMQHNSPINALALGPKNLLATGDMKDGHVMVWDIGTGQSAELPAEKDSKKVKISDLAFNVDSSRLAVSNVFTGKTTIWEVEKFPYIGPKSFNLEKWKQIKAITSEPMLVNSISFSKDGQFIATGDRFNTANLWDAHTGEHLETLYGHMDTVRKIAFSPDGSRLATAGSDAIINIWDIPTHRLLFSLNGHNSQIKDLAFSPDGNRLVTGSDDNAAKIWNVAGHSDALFAVAFSPDGKRFATGSGDNTIKIWATESRKLLQTLSGHEDRVQRLAFHPTDSNILASASYDKTARIWDLSTGKEILNSLRDKNPDKIYDIAFSPKGEWLATASANSNVVVWDTMTGRPLFKGGHARPINAVAFSPDGKHLASISHDAGVLEIWEIRSDQSELVQLATIVNPDKRPECKTFSDVNYSSDGKRLVMATGKPIILLIDDTTALSVKALYPFGEESNDKNKDEDSSCGPGSDIKTAQFVLGDKYILTTGDDNKVTFLYAGTGKEGKEWKSLPLTQKKINDAAVSNDGKWIVTANADMNFHVSPLDSDTLVRISCERAKSVILEKKESCLKNASKECRQFDQLCP